MALPKSPPTVGYALFDTAFGVCGVAWSARGIVRLVLPEASPEVTETRLRRQAKVDARVRPREGAREGSRQVLAALMPGACLIRRGRYTTNIRSPVAGI